MTTLLTVLYVLVCLFLIMVVLLQQGKGADLAGAFGGGGSQTAFGPRTGATLLHKLTTGAFVLFVLLSMALAIMQGKQGGTVMEHVTAPAESGTEQPAPAESTSEQPVQAPAQQPAESAPADQGGEQPQAPAQPAGGQ